MTRKIDKPTAFQLLIQGREELRGRVDALEAALDDQSRQLIGLASALRAVGFAALAGGVDALVRQIDAALKGDA